MNSITRLHFLNDINLNELTEEQLKDNYHLLKKVIYLIMQNDNQELFMKFYDLFNQYYLINANIREIANNGWFENIDYDDKIKLLNNKMNFDEFICLYNHCCLEGEEITSFLDDYHDLDNMKKIIKHLINEESKYWLPILNKYINKFTSEEIIEFVDNNLFEFLELCDDHNLQLNSNQITKYINWRLSKFTLNKDYFSTH